LAQCRAPLASPLLATIKAMKTFTRKSFLN